MKKYLLFIGLIFFYVEGYCQIQPIITFKKEIDSIHYKGSVKWFLLTPYFFSSNRFSPDSGKTFVHAGLVGGNLRPYVVNVPEGLKNLNSYKAIRIAGIVQFWVLAPLFLIRQIQESNTNNGQGPPYTDMGLPTNLFISLGFMYSGAITYHFISKPFLRRALRRLQ